MNKTKKEQLFKEFLLKNKVMIVDKSSASRKRLAKTLSDLDAKMMNVHMFARYDEALKELETIQPALILSDYHLGDGSGFDLFRKYREMETEESKSAVLILITSNVSQSAVAKAAEEDVDSFIIKPYTIDTLQEGLISAFINKLHPTDYMKKVTEGKELLMKTQLDEAMVCFEEAKGMSKKPSLACFYIGQVQWIKQIKEQAQNEYEEGINFNKIHFKCQIGLYELYYKDKMYEEAYEIVKNIAKYFPANPDRLNSIVRLAVITENFQDMNYYYEIFKSLEMRETQTIKYICAGLYVTGKYYLMEEKPSEALKVFSKIAISSQGETKFYRAMIETLVEYEMLDDANKILDRYDSDEKLTNDFNISEFLVKSLTENDEKIIQMGYELLVNNGVENYLSYKVLLTSLAKCKYMAKADDIASRMLELFSEKSDEILMIHKPSNQSSAA